MRISTIVALLAMLQACAAPRGLDLPSLSDWDSRKDILASIEHWEFRGRIGVSAGDEGFNGKFNWQQDGDRFAATVSGPLGVGTVKIVGEGEYVRLTEKDGTETELHNVEDDLMLRYGWTIPVESLRYWALGIPDPRTPAIAEFGDEGLVSRIDQRGWSVIIADYREGGGQAMPRRVTATGSDGKVRLVVDHWAFFE